MKLVRTSQPEKSRAETARERRAKSSEEPVTRAPRAKSSEEHVARTPRKKSSEESASRTPPTSRTARSVVVPTYRSPAVPPVTVRSPARTNKKTTATHSSGSVHKKTGTVRRQYYYSLGSTGAEVRLPSVPMIRPGWRVVSAILVLLLLAGVYLAYNDDRFQVDRPVFTGLKRVKAEEVERIIDLHNQPVFTIDPAAVQKQLINSFAEFSSAAVTVELPAKVSISVTERQPVLAWKVGEKTYWADQDGILFPARGTIKSLLTIEAEGNPPTIVNDIPLTELDQQQATAAAEDKPAVSDLYRQQMDLTFIKAAKDLSKKVPAGTRLVYSAREGLGWSDPGGWTVYVGMDLENIAMKMRVYQAIVDKLTTDEIVPAMISVVNVHAPFYRLEQ